MPVVSCMCPKKDRKSWSLNTNACPELSRLQGGKIYQRPKNAHQYMGMAQGSMHTFGFAEACMHSEYRHSHTTCCWTGSRKMCERMRMNEFCLNVAANPHIASATTGTDLGLHLFLQWACMHNALHVSTCTIQHQSFNLHYLPVCWPCSNPQASMSLAAMVLRACHGWHCIVR